MQAAALLFVLALSTSQTEVTPPAQDEQPPVEVTPPAADDSPKVEVTPPAQDEQPKVEAPPPRTFRNPPPHLYLKKPKQSDRIGRIAVELTASVVGELGGGLVGAFAGCLAVPYGPQGCLLAFLIGALVGGIVGVPIGVLIGGYLMDGNGSIPATVAGALAGVGLSAALIGVVTYNLNADSAVAILSGIGFVLMPNIFSILAFELTSDISRTYSEAMTPPKVAIVPTLGKDRAGLALAMSF